MEKNFFFELITPDKNLINNEFEMVVVPGEEGDFGVLPNHSNLISQIRPGVLKIYKNNKIDKSFFIYNGFAEVSNNKVVNEGFCIKYNDINIIYLPGYY